MSNFYSFIQIELTRRQWKVADLARVIIAGDWNVTRQQVYNDMSRARKGKQLNPVAVSRILKALNISVDDYYADRMQVVCMYCATIVSAGNPNLPVSHGMCARCAAKTQGERDEMAEAAHAR